MGQIIDGIPVEVETRGEGTTSILLLHGFPADRRSLRHSLEPALEGRPGYRRIHVDLPGFGASPARPEIASSDAMVQFIQRLIDDLIGDDSFLIIGESWGAYLARGVISGRRAQVAGAAFICPVVVAVHADRRLEQHRLLYEEPGALEGADSDAAIIFREVAVVVDRGFWEHFRSSLYPAVQAADPETVQRITARYAFADEVDGSEDPYVRPTLIVAGRQDSIVGYRDALDILDRFPRATFAVLDEAGHGLAGERPIMLAALIHDWLDRVERAGA
jgi:pimeloyl-ACP methyl ester carboxylesterase